MLRSMVVNLDWLWERKQTIHVMKEGICTRTMSSPSFFIQIQWLFLSFSGHNLEYTLIIISPSISLTNGIDCFDIAENICICIVVQLDCHHRRSSSLFLLSARTAEWVVCYKYSAPNRGLLRVRSLRAVFGYVWCVDIDMFMYIIVYYIRTPQLAVLALSLESELMKDDDRMANWLTGWLCRVIQLSIAGQKIRRKKSFRTCIYNFAKPNGHKHHHHQQQQQQKEQ